MRLASNCFQRPPPPVLPSHAAQPATPTATATVDTTTVSNTDKGDKDARSLVTPPKLTTTTGNSGAQLKSNQNQHFHHHHHHYHHHHHQSSRRRRALSRLVALLQGNTSDLLTQSLLINMLLAAAFILVPIGLIYMYLTYFVAAPSAGYDAMRNGVFDDSFVTATGSKSLPLLPLSPDELLHMNTLSSYRLNKSIHASLATPENQRHIQLRLEQTFSIPTALSKRIPVLQNYALLSKLQSLWVNESTTPPRVFFLHVVGPSADRRLRAMASAITYARNTGRLLFVLWDTANAPGGEAHEGEQPLEVLPKHAAKVITNSSTDATGSDRLPEVVFGYVNSFHLARNTSHWSDLAVNYFTSPSTEKHPLDSITKLASRHIFFRSDSNRVSGKYSALLPGVQLLPAYVQLAPKEAGNTIRGEWNALVSRWTFPQLDDNQVPEILHRVYAIPCAFLTHMASNHQRMLLHLLDRSKSKRAFFVHVQYGMGNRLRALGSALAISRVTGRVPVLIWEPDIHLDCRFSDLFVNELAIVEKMDTLAWPPQKRGDPSMESVDFFNFMRNEGKGRHDPTRNLVNPRHGRHVYAKSAYVIRSSFTPRILSTRSKYWKIMRDELVPCVEVMMIVLDPMFANIDEMVGVHIRARTIENDIKGVGHETYGAASKTTDRWRRRTGLKTFEEKIRRLSLKYNYFVAADMKETIKELERKFGAHRIFSVPRDKDCVSRGVECAKLALADILLLSRVATLLGSHWSSFSEAAVRFSGTVKLLLAGVHFG